MTLANKNIRTWIIESVVIIASILLAFWIDTAWGQHLERKEEYKILVGLQDQFERLSNELIGITNRYNNADTNLSKVLYPGLLIDQSTETNIRALNGVAWSGTYDPGKGVLESALESGQIDIIQNDSLRNLLTQWSSVLDECLDNETTMREYVNRIIIPFLSKQKIGTRLGNMAIQSYQDSYATPLAQNDVQHIRQIFKNEEFIGLATWRHIWLRLSSEEFKTAASKSKEVLDALTHELNNHR
jgi:hypothetical protein